MQIHLLGAFGYQEWQVQLQLVTSSKIKTRLDGNTLLRSILFKYKCDAFYVCMDTQLVNVRSDVPSRKRRLHISYKRIQSVLELLVLEDLQHLMCVLSILMCG